MAEPEQPDGPEAALAMTAMNVSMTVAAAVDTEVSGTETAAVNMAEIKMVPWAEQKSLGVEHLMGFVYGICLWDLNGI